ncbi:hypothetical protein GH714_006580 [Hevea brasiliensis]|uniref:GST C-terminal domain-containing protein n=1 Tax=Hevea brasiliensis TaxID=3981 RepID=A0A6A6NG15_HEVBR|nr:hypothetical protein GH714_006580 [Hevea brasiliensis]
MEIKQLSFAADRPPLSVLAAAKDEIARYICASCFFATLVGLLAFRISMERTPSNLARSEFENACTYIDSYLEKRTFLVGYYLSIADMAIWSGLAATGQRWESLRKSQKYPSLVRWFNSMSIEYGNGLNEVTTTYVGKRGLGKPVTAKSKEQQVVNRDMSEKGKSPVVFFTLGMQKPLLNQYFAQRYQGELIVRFDDTNPAKESSEFVENLLKDIETLDIKYVKVTHTSDYFDKLMEKAEELIRQGKAYVDDTPREQMQKERMDGIESKCRNNSVEESLKLWKEMIKGSERGLQCCLRGKLDMQDPNNPFEIQSIIVAILFLTIELGPSTIIQEDLGCRKVHIYEFSRLNMVYTLLSKRNLRWFVENGKVDGWDDPRFPTVQGIVRRGSIKNLNLMEWDKLWTINKKIIDPVCPRHTAVIEERCVLLTLTNGPDNPFVRIIPRHKNWKKENFLDVLNPGTKRETAALGDSNMRNLKRGEILQLERKGYFRCDVPFIRPSKPIVLFAIPDGRQATSSK